MLPPRMRFLVGVYVRWATCRRISRSATREVSRSVSTDETSRAPSR